MSSDRHDTPPALRSFGWPLDLWFDAARYGVDTWQRSVLYLDVLRQRGNQYFAQMAMTVPNVLEFGAEPVLDGRTLPRPVGYGLVRIRPPEGVVTDPKKRPFIVIDPRAGQSPGIGGFKPDSEIGVALAAGHTCYFVGFLPRPVHGQTMDDVIVATATFVEHVRTLHGDADGKPVVVGNCQAGWQSMMAAASRPDAFGPIIIPGTPLSYWAGWRGKNPMRYSGGLLGGTWMAALWGDIGCGLFDGAWLIQNFEQLNPANTLWSKQYNLYSHIDTEPPRYLAFERWWGDKVLMGANEMQYIADNLFVGNKLTAGALRLADGTAIDLRSIRSPIICFCSRGDEITPPPQALGWITDLYKDVEDIRAHGQTIVYMIHDRIGHLGIFVSASIARKEHGQFASNIDFIDALPPGLYEAELIDKTDETANPDLAIGDYVLRFAARTIEDVRAIVQPRPDDDRRFAAVARISEVNKSLYETFARPLVRASVTEPVAEAIRLSHPLRLQYALFSDRNPFLSPVAALADQVRARRAPANARNVFGSLESLVAHQIVVALDTAGRMRDAAQEATFLALYGSPVTQALAGLPPGVPVRVPVGDRPEQRAFAARRKEELRRHIHDGGVLEASLRCLLYIAMPNRVADERGFNLLNRLRREGRGGELTLAAFKALVRDQYAMLQLDPAGALAALPEMLARADAEQIERYAARLRDVAEAAGALSPEAEERLAAVEDIFALAAKQQRATGAPAEAVPEAASVARDAPDLNELVPPDRQGHAHAGEG